MLLRSFTPCDEAEFCVLAYTEEEKVTEFLDEIQKRCLDRCRYMLENDIGEIFMISGAEFVTPPMMPPCYFAKYVTPYTKELVDLIHSYGKKAMIHCHGRILDVLPEFKKIGMDMLHPVEAPPNGDCTFTQARAVLGDEVIFVGNIQSGDMMQKDAKEMEAFVKNTLAENKNGRLILSMCSSPLYPKLDERLIENHRVVIESALKYGNYLSKENAQ